MLEERLKSLKGRHPQILGHENSFRSAVMIPLVEKNGELSVLFEKRASDLDHQPSEICFPGGKIEKDDADEKAGAIRETCEELGLDIADVEIIAPLDILVSPFNFMVYPFVGRITEADRISPCKKEVAYTFMVPVSYLMKYEPITKDLGVKLVPPSDYPFELIPQGRNYPFITGSYSQYFYIWEEEVIWGLTARILHHFIQLLKTKG